MKTNDLDKGKLAQQYDKFSGKFNELYLTGKERGREAMSVALEKAHEQMMALGEFSAEQGAEMKKYLARDLDQTIADAQQLGEKAKEQLHPSRLGAGALASLATMLELGGNALITLGGKTKEKLVYKTGEITSAGTLTCQACGENCISKIRGTSRLVPSVKVRCLAKAIDCRDSPCLPCAAERSWRHVNMRKLCPKVTGLFMSISPTRTSSRIM